ncbi:MAG: TolC family protein [Bacteroidales bacterium]|jgi:outer membrane protein|nr:TolC family protein [Bacteroidales bacterium]MDD4257529.1 TolC family protein [Bacteroidales bacterium]MDD4827354.1 TolC family protein [Bacteroidales bacterium]
MIRLHSLSTVLASVLLLITLPAQGQEQAEPWTLQKCIEYARVHNIEVQTREVSKAVSDVELEQTRAQRFPTLNFSSSFGVSFQNATTYNDFMEETDAASYSDNFGLNTGVTLYAGGKLSKTIQQKKLDNTASGYDVEQALFDIEISVIQAYLQILYANESYKIALLAADLSRSQVERGLEMRKAGSMSKGDLAQLQSQAAGDNYQVTQTKNALASAKLQLKQLLELDLEATFEVEFPDIDSLEVLNVIPDLASVYLTALDNLPQMKSSALSIESAQMGIEIAKASKMPTLTASASINTGTNSSAGTAYFEQLGSKISENVGLNLSIPIFSNKQVRTNITKAKLQSKSAELQDQSTRKQLLSTIESLHNDAVSAQSQYISANEQLQAAKISFEVVSEQFRAGLINTIELITGQNNYTSALSNQLQAKFQTVLAIKLLKLYQGQNS